MLAIIRNEFREIRILGGLLAIVPLIHIIILSIWIWDQTRFQPSLDNNLFEAQIIISVTAFIYMPLIAAVIGCGQILNDRLRKISTFLATQAITRDQIFWGRMITGLCYLFLLLVLIRCFQFILIHTCLVPDPALNRLISRMSTLTILMTITSYCLGILAGLHRSKLCGPFLAWGVLVFLFAIASIYGPGITSYVLLSIVTYALAGRSWQKFRTIPL